ncbi:MAG: DnaJ domain-containing protein [Bacteroidetes bacterium]|nr:DnaJ domain-containing protein [Bacteroidota bacterium]
MEYRDYYKILGVGKGATADDIKKAYRQLARQYHPDTNPNDAGAEQKFKEVSEAYEVLSNPESRQQYDKLGSNWKQYGQGGGPRQQQQWEPQDGGFAHTHEGFGSGFSDFFRTFFGGGFGAEAGARQQGRQGDLRATLSISLEDAYRGGTKTVGLGEEHFSLNLKPGLSDGKGLKVRGRGRKRPDGSRGDLLLNIQVVPHPLYERDGNNLHREVALPLYDAVLGGPYVLDTLGGKVKLNLKEGTQPGGVLRLKQKGMPVYEQPGQYGDLYLHLGIALPQRLSAQERKLFEQLRSLQKN